MKVRTKGGALRDGLCNAVMMSLNNEKYLLAVITDITERKQAEEALRKSEGKYRSLIENINDGIYILDSFEKFTFVNDVIVERFGYPAEWFLGRDYLSVISEIDRERVRRHFNAVMKGKTQVYDLSYANKSGNLIHIEVSTAPLFDGAKVIGLLGISRDITDHKRMQKELLDQHQQLEALVKERTADLESKTLMLNDINKALKVLLMQRDEERRDLEDQFVANVKTFILPYIKKMKNDGLDTSLNTYLNIIESNLNELISPFMYSIRQHNFTPKEMIVASLIRDGKTTKDIAKLMKVGTSAIDSHRHRIRKKLGLREKRNINLQSYLSVLK
jgi:PAS domain S-box-containing protein